MTKAVAAKTKKGITKLGQEVTGKEDYKLSDVTRAVTEKAKQRITKIGQEVTGKKDSKVGEMTKAVTQKAKETVEAAAGAAFVAAEEAAEQAAAAKAQKLIDGRSEKKKAADAEGKVVTKDQASEFGDVTTGVLKSAKGLLNKAKKAVDDKQGRDGQQRSPS
eukprot:gnl/MRDRNA2_/MRDRNA2_22376_c0_seq1.p1 gnl/MRDRNA2_/MRDRNA2_22376_c0~~gnl/MRDRNA2_/MRDRNA2_22376_c0_seq1.p1  ORF type:complete len:173 (+),score=73.60 gnl/MRDRNA2_/MRDRNA2_22376_c0_seq1:34-519(+)